MNATDAPRNSLAIASITDDKTPFQREREDGSTVEVSGTVTVTASSRRIHDHDDVEAAGRVVVDALYAGRLIAYVRDREDREYYRLVRDYWQDVEIEDEGAEQVVPPYSCKGGDWRDGVLDQPILVPRAGFDGWMRDGLAAYGKVSAFKPVSLKALRDWVRSQFKAGFPKEYVASASVRKDAFRENVTPPREQVRKLFDEVAAEAGKTIRRGRPTAA